MKNLLKLGKSLDKVEQKEILGGRRSVGLSDGDCNQTQQSQITCNPYGSSSECDMDAVCIGINPIEVGNDATYPIGDGSNVYYLSGRCSCL